MATLVVGSALIRDGLTRILSDSGFKIEQATSNPALVAVDSLEPEHVLIVEDALFMNREGVLDSGLVRRFARCRLVVLADQFDLQLMRNIFEAGAHGCILKDIPYQSFVAMIQLVSLGEKVVPSRLIDELPKVASSDSNGSAADGYLRNLNDREKNILDLLVLGLPNKGIARDLGISEASVKVAVKAIFRKLAVKNRTQAALLGRTPA